MSESRVVEIYENQLWSNGQWIPDPNTPWTTKDNMPSRPADELQLPGTEWTWESNWRISKKPGGTDKDGWEFASRIERFSDPNRKPKPEKLWNDKCRRRQYSRVMRRDSRAAKAAQFIEAMPRIQKGLRSIYTVRVRIEQVVKQAPEAIHEPQMIRLVDTVRENMLETLHMLNTLDSSGLTHAQVAVIKKLRHDLEKEETAIERAVMSQGAPGGRLPNAPGLPPRGHSFASGTSGGSDKLPANGLGMARGHSFATSTSSASARSSPVMGRVTGRNGAGAASGNGKVATQLSGSVPTRGSSPFLVGTAAGSNGSLNPEASSSSVGNSSNVQGSIVRATPKSVISGGRNEPLTLSFSSAGLSSSSQVEEGVFMERSAEEQEILQKLKPIDHVDVNARIIEERAVAIEEIHKGLVEVNEMFIDLAKIIREQQGDVDAIFRNCDESHAKTAEAFSQIVEADRLQQESCLVS